jgi:hypothetical protein
MDKNIINEDLYILETILDQFIPYFSEINSNTRPTAIKLIQDLITYITNHAMGKKKRSTFNYDNNINLEEKEFLYKTYISSSDTNTKNVKFISNDTLIINHINSQMVRSLLILLKDELSNYKPGLLLNKLKSVKKLVLNEIKPFDYKLLFILLNFIIKSFCTGLTEILFEGTFHSRIEQIDIMLKNGVYLYFINNSTNVTQLTINNKIEFLNENLAFKILHEYLLKNNISDVNAEKVEINKINIFNFLPLRVNLNNLCLSKVAIDKNSAISALIRVLQFNENLKEFCVDRFISIPMHYKKEMIDKISKLAMLKKLKLGVVSASKEDFIFFCIPNLANSIKKFKLKLGRVSLEDYDLEDSNINQMTSWKNTKLTKLSLYFDKFEISQSDFIENMLSNRLKVLSLGYIGKNFISSFYKIRKTLKLEKLKLSFLPILDEDYDEVFKNILNLIESFLLIKNFAFMNFSLKYKNIVDEEIRSVILANKNLRKLIIQSDLPFHVQNLEGFFFYEYQVIYVENFLPIIKKHKLLSMLYYKKNIVKNIFDFLCIKKDKHIEISYIV